LTVLAMTAAAGMPTSSAVGAPGSAQLAPRVTYVPALYPDGARLFWVTGDFELVTDRHVPLGPPVPTGG